MSTSHYSRTDYSDLVGKSGIKSSDKNPSLAQMREAVYAWEDALSHPSLTHSRPECSDVGSQTIRFNITPKPQLPRLTALLFAGIMLLLADGAAIAYYSDSVVEATLIALATMPTGGFIIATAIAIRNQN